MAVSRDSIVILHIVRENYVQCMLSVDQVFFLNNNEKFRSFKSKENIYKKEVGPYRCFGY